MRPYVAVVACLLAGPMLAVPAALPAHAANSHRTTLRLHQPVTTGNAALLAGRVTGRHGRVDLQQLESGHWVKVRSLAVRHHVYRTSVALTADAQVFRTAVRGVVSSSRTVAAAVPSDACGTRPRKPDGSYWACTFDDEFNGTSLDRTKWVPQTVFSSGNYLGAFACYFDDPSVVSVSGGTLNLSVRKVATAQTCQYPGLPIGSTQYLAGMVSTYHLFSQRYGRFEARLKTTATSQPGLQEEFWLWPDDRDPLGQLPWPLNGEIDVAETYSQYPTLDIPFLHYGLLDNGGPIPGTNTAWNCTAQRGVFNTYTLEWTPSKIQIFVNGQSCLVNTSGDSAFAKNYILDFTQALGYGTNSYVGTAPMPATMNVDYVKVWQ
jgi:beta-glucanase (GH16 family)